MYVFKRWVKWKNESIIKLYVEDFEKYILQHLDKKVVKFSYLENYNDIYQLLPEWEDYRIILIEQKSRMGHWVCLTRGDDIFIFFDSYGYNPFQNLN